jgi:4-amino-4-deoxy-L-arabinose transferase-like glycosyltransferase
MDGKGNQFRLYFILLLIAAAPLFSLGLANHGLWTPDEPRVAEIGREMALNGNWAVPTLDQNAFLEEPPLYYAATGALFKALGTSSDKVVRVPSAVFAFGGVLGLFFLGNMFSGPRCGFIAAGVMAASGEYFRVAHWVIVDSALTCFIICGLLFFLAAYLSPRKGRRSLFYVLCYISCTLAFYAKGFIGVAIPGVAVLAFLVLDRNIKEILKMHLWLGIAVFLAMTLPWFLSLWRQGGGEYLRIFLIHNHLERFAGGSTGHSQPVYYYLTQFPAAFLPWSFLLVPVFFRSFRKPQPLEGNVKKGILFAQCWFIAGFLLLSMASTKRVLYLMPIFAPISLLTAWYIEATLVRAGFGKLEDFFIHAFGWIILMVSLATIPLFFYASRKYGFGLPPEQTAWTVLFALAAVILSLMALMALRSQPKHIGRFWGCSGASVFSLLLLGLLAAMPLLDRYKSFVPFCNTVSTAVPATAPLYAYQPDETLRGVVPFYTGRFLTEIETLPALEETIGKAHTAFVVIRDKNGKIEEELLSTGRLSVLARLGMDATRSVVLFTTGRVP